MQRTGDFSIKWMDLKIVHQFRIFPRVWSCEGYHESYSVQYPPHIFKTSSQSSILFIPLAQRSSRGVYWFHLVRPSVHPSVCLWTESYLLYLPQYLPDPFPIYTSYQPTSEGMQHVDFCEKIWNFGKFFKFAPLTLSFLTWDPLSVNSMGNYGAAGVSSEHRHSSCSSYIWFFYN